MQKIVKSILFCALFLFSSCVFSSNKTPNNTEQGLIELCKNTKDPVKKKQICDALKEFQAVNKAMNPITETKKS